MGKATKRHPLVDATRPNLLEDIFPHDLPPLIRLEGPVVERIDGQPVEFDFSAVKDREILISDTTFRDGQQSRPPYTTEQMVHIYDLLARLGGPNGVIRQTEFFLTPPCGGCVSGIGDRRGANSHPRRVLLCAADIPGSGAGGRTRGVRAASAP